MFRSDRLCAAVDESMMVIVSKDNKEVEVEVWGHVIKERSVAECITESHPIHEEIGLV